MAISVPLARVSAVLGLGLAALTLAGPDPAAAQVRFHGEPLGASASVKVMTWRDIPFRTVVRQQYDYSCGSAALATLLTYHYGRKTSESETFKAMFDTGDQARIRQVGFSMLDMKRYLEGHGIKADGFRMTVDDLGEFGAPTIVLIDLGKYRHFVVVKGVSKDKILVGDPALGLRTYSKAEFAKIWNGIAFGIHSTPALAKPAFNLAAEWSPWSTAPLGSEREFNETGVMSVHHLAPLYQIQEIRSLESISAGGVQ